jgi:hypothetical protein
MTATPDDTSADFLGSDFGSRHAQDEKFYGGPSFIAKQNLYRNFDFKRHRADGQGAEFAGGGVTLRLPLPVGERVGVRGFGRMEFFSNAGAPSPYPLPIG